MSARRVSSLEAADGVDLVRGPEAVEEMEEGNAGPQGGGVGDGGEIVRLLRGVGGQHGPAALAAGHDVGVVAENRQGVGGEGAGADMDDARREFAGDLVHVGDHQQEPLRGGESAGQHAALHHAVHGPGRAALGLHLDHLRHLAPDVGLTGHRPFISVFGHRGRRRYRVDGEDLAEAVGGGGNGLIPIQG